MSAALQPSTREGGPLFHLEAHEPHARVCSVVQGERLPAPCKVNNSPEANYVKLANGVLMPMIGYGTFQVQDVDIIK